MPDPRGRGRNDAPLAKISRPRLGIVYPRKRLFRLLDQTRSRPVLWVAGPPGCGKTTLISSYIERTGLQSLWYQLDAGDADLASFFYYLGLAARRAAPRRKKSLPLLTPEYALDLQAFSRNFFRDLFARLKTPFWLVFDDYQEVPDSTRLDELVLAGLTQVPSGGNVVIVSRNELPPAFSRLQANQAISRLESEALRLTPEEMKGVTRLLTDRPHEKAELNSLHKKIRGWMAGLILLIEHDGWHASGAGRSFETEPPQVIFDYFAGEVFDKTDVETKEFLLRTAWFPSIPARLAKSLAGSADAGEILEKLRRKHFFTTRVSSKEPVYRYHPLFQEFLRTRARRTLSAVQLVELQKKAAELLNATGDIERAAEVLLEAQDWAGLTRLINERAPELHAQGRFRTLERWLNWIPLRSVEHTPWLMYWLGVCRANYEPKEARTYLDAAFEEFKQQDDAPGMYLAWSEFADTFFRASTDLSPLDGWFDKLDELQKRHPQLPSPEIELRFASSVFNALNWRRPAHPELMRWRERIEKLLARADDTRLRIDLGGLLFVHYTQVGETRKARWMFELLRKGENDKELPPFTRIGWQMWSSVYHWYVTGDWARCSNAVEQGLAMARESGVRIYDLHLRTQAIYGALSSGHVDSAKESLDALAPYVAGDRSQMACHYMGLVSWEAALRNDTARATEYGRLAVELSHETGAPFHEAVSRIRFGHALIQSGDYGQAMEQIADARRISAESGNRQFEVECLVAEAELAFARGETSQALESLRAGLVLSKELGYGWRAYFRPKALATLFARALEHDIEVVYVQTTIRELGLEAPDRAVTLDNWPWPIRVYTLGRFALVRDGEGIHYPVQAKRKQLAMLQALVALGGRAVGETQLSDTLWPDAEGGAAHQGFATTLHRVRKMLENDKAIVLRDQELSLNPRLCWVDSWAFERLAREVSAVQTPLNDSAARAGEQAMALYSGPFLGASDGKSWALPARERLRSKFVRLVKTLARHSRDVEDWERSAALYEKGLDVEPLAEELYRQLMLCYEHLGRRAEALAVYKRARGVMEANFGAGLSRETESIYERLRSDE